MTQIINSMDAAQTTKGTDWRNLENWDLIKFSRLGEKVSVYALNVQDTTMDKVEEIRNVLKKLGIDCWMGPSLAKTTHIPVGDTCLRVTGEDDVKTLQAFLKRPQRRSVKRGGRG